MTTLSRCTHIPNNLINPKPMKYVRGYVYKIVFVKIWTRENSIKIIQYNKHHNMTVSELQNDTRITINAII